MYALTRLSVLTAIALLLWACASAPDVSDMVVAQPAEPHRFPQSLREGIQVTNVAGGEKTNPLWTSEINADGLRSALIESLKAWGRHDRTGEGAPYALIAVILDAKQPLAGLDMTVTTTVEYTLLDNATGAEVLHEAISSSYTAKVSDAFYGVERLKMANEGAVRENIRLLLDRLSRLALP